MAMRFSLVEDLPVGQTVKVAGAEERGQTTGSDDFGLAGSWIKFGPPGIEKLETWATIEPAHVHPPSPQLSLYGKTWGDFQ